VVIFRYENNFRLPCFAIIFLAIFGCCALQTKKKKSVSWPNKFGKPRISQQFKSKLKLFAPCVTVTASQIS